MRHIGTTLLGQVLIVTIVGCAADRTPPKSLVDARAEVQRSRDGIAMQLDPTDVHEAEKALVRAEQAFHDDPDALSTQDFALIAQRRALIAESEADGLRSEQQTAMAKQQIESTMASELQSTRSQLQTTQSTLGQTQLTNAELTTKLASARATISKIAAVKDDQRGMVITLQGELLFRTDKAELKPAAMAKLDEIADALKNSDQTITVYGYTDNTGTRDHNMTLSENRANAVRDYLTSKGIPRDLVTAQGKGPDNPVAENTSVEGRAENRRVEIVVSPKSK